MKREQRVADFVKALTDIQTAYIEAEHAAETLEVENAKLRELLWDVLLYYSTPGTIDYKRESVLLERAHDLEIEVEK